MLGLGAARRMSPVSLSWIMPGSVSWICGNRIITKRMARVHEERNQPIENFLHSLATPPFTW